MRAVRAATLFALTTLVVLSAGSARGGAQEWTAAKPGSDDIELVSHLPLGAPLSNADIEIEQELARPYAYVAGWSGEDWGYPNISSAQDWDRGPGSS